MSANLESEVNDGLYANHLYCAGKAANQSSETADEQEMRAEESEMHHKERCSRNWRQDARSVTNSTPSLKGSRLFHVVSGMRHLSSMLELFSMRPSHRTRRKRRARSVKNRRKETVSLPSFYSWQV